MSYTIDRIELPTAFGMKTVNSYVLRGGDEVVLLDCGEHSPAVEEKLTQGLKELGLEFADIDRLLITHPHVDHIGMAYRIAELADCNIWVNHLAEYWALDPKAMMQTRNRLTFPLVSDYFSPQMRPLYKQALLAMMEGVLKVWLPIPTDRITKYPINGQMEIVGETWEVVHTPGHCPSMSTFFNVRTGDYLSADMLFNVTPTPLKEPITPDDTELNEGAIQDLLRSYERVSRMDIRTIYPGHYEIFDDAKVKIHHQVKRIHERKGKTFDLIKQGATDFLSIYNVLYQNNFYLPAVVMTMGYLDLLIDENRISIDDSGEMRRFVVR